MMRLLLALVIALLPMPAAGAAQPCHQAPEPVMAMLGHEGHQMPAPAPRDTAPAAADQLCIGCVAPATAMPPIFGEPLAPAPLPAPALAASGEPGGAIRPALPPPRSDA